MKLATAYPLSLAIGFLSLLGRATAASEDTDQTARGAKIYTEKCLMCHQASGQGAPPLFPPLAGSDWLKGDRTRVIKVLCEGLSGTVTVSGQTFSNAMPAQILDDAAVADVLTYAGHSWGNAVEPFTSHEVRKARGESRFKTYAALLKAASYQPLPAAPAGWALRELAQLPEFCTRIASDEEGQHVFLLAQTGSIYTLDPASGALVRIIKAEEYLAEKGGDYVTLGITVEKGGRLWVTSNQKLTKGVPVYTNEVVIWRSSGTADGHPAKLERWFTHRYPQGVGGFNHGVSNLAFGPDGMLYVSSGSRTDGGEISHDPHYASVQEVETTSCVWRLDPTAATPQLEVLARGIRNAYAFAWDGKGNLFTFSNGPDYDAGEEMDWIQPGKHYGFPYQFEDWPVKPHFPYRHTPAPPPGLVFTHPVVNLGPDGGGQADKPARTFTPHSSPGGTVWCGEDFPEPLRNSFVMPRFGNLLEKPKDVGFDVLSVRPTQQPDGSWTAEVHTLLAPLGRPLDTRLLPGHRVLILEYTRPLNFKDGAGWLPGRVLELAPEAKAK